MTENHSVNPWLTQAPKADPAQLLRFRDRQNAAELVAAALLHLDFFSWLQAHPKSETSSIQENFGFHPRPLDVMLTLFRASGLIRTLHGDRHELTDLGSETLVAESPWYLGPYYEPLRHTQCTLDYLKILVSGKPANWRSEEDGKDWHESMLTDSFAKSFTALMNCRGLALGQALAAALKNDLSDRKRFLDVGAGSGIYGSAMAAAYPQLTGYALEQPPVDAITKSEIERNGLSSRIQTVTADMFRDPWPDDIDTLLLSNVLHDWDFPEVELLLNKAHQTLPQNGLLIIHEAFIYNDKSGPLPSAEYSALLMSITQGKCYTPKEYGDILEKLGFRVGPYLDTLADRGVMTAVKL